MQSLALDIKYKKRAIETLVDNAHHHKDFYVLLIGAVLLAIWGIFTDNIPVVIASTIIVPLAYPILGLGLGPNVRDWRLGVYTLLLLIIACLIALIVAVGTTLLFNDARVNDAYVAFTENHYLAAAIAAVPGVIAVFGLIRRRVAPAITGIAFAVSLLPLLVAVGIGFASADANLTSKALTLFSLNIVGLLIASIIVFRMFTIRNEYNQR